MNRYTKSQKESLLSVPIGDILSHFGKRTVHTRSGMYYSPFRDEKTPSFSVKESSGCWYDFGSDEGGGVIDLVCRLAGTDDRSQAYDILASIAGEVPQYEDTVIRRPHRQKANNIAIIRKGTFHNSTLLRYAASRGISREILERYCSEIRYKVATLPGREFFAIGFHNHQGGLVLRSVRSKTCTGSGHTQLDALGQDCDAPTCPTVTVFEGFMDFLSWMECGAYEFYLSDSCILNSVSNLGHAMDFITGHSTICTCLDNDDAGRKALQAITKATIDKKGVQVNDLSGIYSGYKDVNEMLSVNTAERQRLILNIEHHGSNF